MNDARTPWAPWMAWMDVAASISDMALASGPAAAQRGARVAQAGAPLSARDAREFTLMGMEKLQAAGEAMQAMFMPAIVNGGALGIKLAEVAWHQAQRNLRLLHDWSPLAFADPPSTWGGVPFEASTQAMTQAVQQGNYLAATAEEAAHAVNQVSRTASRAAKRGIKPAKSRPVKSRVAANPRRLAKR